ncbi:MAG: undecaprenyl-diphosphate phosphatase [Clostridia bacterium]|nr:undecaprenyl-diphosphate phosphatase [Clostridia bacterium]
MKFLTILKVILLGIIEGITEWLPVSSTGHMKLFNSFWAIKDVSAGFTEMFEYVIQLAAILAVVILFWNTIFPLGKAKTAKTDDAQPNSEKMKIVWKKDVLTLWGKVLVACVPAVLALLPDMLFEKLCEKHPLIEPLSIACTLILYGVAFIVIENFNKKRTPKITETDGLSFKYAFFIGCFQLLAAIPGTSRSGITIIGALLLGVDRTTASKFTFVLAIPVMVGASAYKLLKFFLDAGSMSGAEIGYLLIGCAVAFAVSLVAIKFLMNFVKKHDFKLFGWYRIALGAVVIGALIIPQLIA